MSDLKDPGQNEPVDTDEQRSELEKYYVASQWQMVWRKFRRHRLAMVGGAVIILFYLVALFAEFIAPYPPVGRNRDYVHAPPQRVRFIDDDGGFHLRPFVYPLTSERNPETLRLEFVEDRSTRDHIYFFVRGGQPYRLFGMFRTDVRLFGVKEGPIYLFGADSIGRDLFSRVIYATRISTTIGLVGVFLSFILGCTLGGISGFFGGKIDTIIQRFIEFVISLPTIPLWMALSAAIPPGWPPLQVYFGITVILSFIGWGGLARVVRGKLLELREEDYVMAAKVAGSSPGTVIRKHLLPGFASYLIVNLTISIPHMILGETALSFLGLGLRPPVVSWGTLLQAAQNIRSVALHPWLLIPGAFVVVFVLAFNFLGDGLRDAADPYS